MSKKPQKGHQGPPSGMPPMGKPKNVMKTLARLLGTLSGNVGWFILALVMAALSSLAGVFGNWYLKPLLNGLEGGVGAAQLGKSLLLLAAVYAGGMVFTYLSSRVMVSIAQKTTHKLRGKLFGHMQSLPLVYFDTHTHGELMSRLTNDIENVNMALEQSLISAVTSLITVVGTFFVMLSLSPILTVLMLIMMALMLFSMKTIGSKSAQAFRAQQQTLGSMNGYIEEMIEGQKVVKVFNHEHHSAEEFEKRNKALQVSATDAQAYAGMIMPVMGNLSYVNYAVIAMLGAIMAINGMMDIGTIGAFLQSSRSFSMPVTQIANQMNMLLAALAGAERIFDVLDEKPEVDAGKVKLVLAKRSTAGLLTKLEGDPFENLNSAFSSNAEHNMGGADNQAADLLLAWALEDGQLRELRGDVRFEDVDFSYIEEKPVLKQISLYGKPGQKIAFVGSTGAGKTTITNLINRFYDIQKGRITYDGVDIRDIEKGDLRRTLGIVLQDVHLFQGTIRENIRYGKLNATDEEIERAAKIANAHSFIKRLPDGYDTLLTADGINLSQGQRQLLSIARAAVADPPVLILDEATSSIDTRTEKLIEKGMNQLMHGRTTFVIAHRLSTVRNANAIMVLEQGRIIERGDHQALLDQKGRYWQLYTGAAELA